jgi:chorismate dehydratase
VIEQPTHTFAAKITQLNKIKVGFVNYLNTRPLIYGFGHLPIKDEVILIEQYPARLAGMLKDDEIDIGLIPVAVLPEIPGYKIVGDYCIASEGEVASVCLFSEVPMNEIKKIYLDYQSRSSVALLKWLMKEFWGLQAELIHTTDDNFRNKIKGSAAGLVIGDRALQQRRVSTFIYDLSSEWRKITGLPFVFAVWVSKKEFPETFIRQFNEANAEGLKHMNEIAAANPFPEFDLKKYYRFHISYKLDERKMAGMQKFLEVMEH